MKNLFLALSVLCFIAGCHTSPSSVNRSVLNVYDSVITIKSIQDTAGLLKLCFSTSRIVQNTALWKPTLDDWFNMPLSADSLCHSTLDTIIKTSADTSLIFFRTDAYSENNVKLDGHVSSPTYSIATAKKHGDYYEILNFKKDLINVGSFGNGYDSLTVENFGANNKLICFSSSYVGNSSVTSTNTYFTVNDYRKVFDFNTYHTQGDSAERDTGYFELTQHLMHISGRDNRDDIMLKGILLHFDKASQTYKKQPVKEYYRQDNWDIYRGSLN